MCTEKVAKNQLNILYVEEVFITKCDPLASLTFHSYTMSQKIHCFNFCLLYTSDAADE